MFFESIEKLFEPPEEFGGEALFFLGVLGLIVQVVCASMCKEYLRTRAEKLVQTPSSRTEKILLIKHCLSSILVIVAALLAP